MSVVWNGVTLTVEVGFASLPSTQIAGTTWTDVSAYVRSIAPRRGRNDELGTFQAGTMQIVLDNRDRRFDPNYTSSPYSPNVLPMKRIRFRATYNAVTYSVWSGFVDDWPQEYDIGNHDATVTLNCTDAFKVMSRLRLPESVYAIRLPDAAPVAWWRLGEQSGTVAYDSSGNGKHGTYVGGATFNTRTGLVYGGSESSIGFDGVDDYVEVPPVVTAYPFTIEAWISTTVAGMIYSQFNADASYGLHAIAGSSGVKMTLYQQLGAGISQYVTQTNTSIADGLTHHVVIDVTDGNSDATIYIDGVVQVVTNTTSALPVAFPTIVARAFINGFIDGVGTHAASAYSVATLEEVAVYNYEPTPTLVLTHYQYGTAPYDGDTSGARVGRLLDLVAWPFADRTVATGISTLQSLSLSGATLFSKMQDVEASEQGQLFIAGDGTVVFRDRHWRFENSLAITSNATFGDGAGELDYSDLVTDGGAQFIANHVRASRTSGATVDVSDSTSIGKFYEITDEITGLENQSDLEVVDLANWRLNTRKNPIQRVTVLEVRPRRDPANLFPQVLGRDIGDRITVKRRPQGVGTALTYTLLIEGVEHSVSTSGDWVTRWYLSSFDSQTAVQPLILDDTTYGKLDTGVLAY